MTSLASPVRSLSDTIAHLRQFSQLDVRDRWRLWEQDLPIAEGCNPEQWHHWPLASLNDKGYILWEQGRQVRWLAQQIIVPADLHGYPLTGLVLRMALTVWTEPTHVYVNGQMVQECDLFDHSPRILLASHVQPGDVIAIALRLVSPGHDDGALMKSLCLYEVPRDEPEVATGQSAAAYAVPTQREPGFIADELAVLDTYLTALDPSQQPLLTAAIAAIDWDAIHDRAAFDRSIHALYTQLQPLSAWIKQRQIRLMGHSHLDLVWLWTWDETCAVAERMFKSVLSLQAEFSTLRFCQSSPVLYHWLEQHRPALFAAIQAQMQVGRWEPVGGMWVEPELNTLHGESLVRQVLHGQRYVQSRFGRLDTIAWLPDSFGFCWQLPQILQQGGIDYLVTQKLSWNDATTFPHAAFWWQAPDGSRVFTVMSSMVGEGIHPLKMAAYGSDWEKRTHLPDAMWLFGVGDHGGGPTRDMLEVADRWATSPFFPTVTTSTVRDYLATVRDQETNPKLSALAPETPTTYPVWTDEVYLECHRGSYTTHGDQKRWNRCCEARLREAELWSSLATIATHSPYPQESLDPLWQGLLFNQFHDILPGSSIPEVFGEANQTWRWVEAQATDLRDRALTTLAHHIALPPSPFPDCQVIIVFNALNWPRSEVMTIPGQGDTDYQIVDAEGRVVTSQRTSDGQVLFWAAEIPAVGYRIFWQRSLGSISRVECEIESGIAAVLETEHLRVQVDPTTGDLSSVVDKITQQEVLSGPGNQLQAFADPHKYWDAWNIDPNYEQHPLPASTLQSWQWIDRGALRQRLRVTRTVAHSTFQQDYILDAGSSVLRIDTIADWQDKHIILKAAFPLSIQADRVTYEIPCGAIQRPTQSDDPMQQAKWEVPALQWADLTAEAGNLPNPTAAGEAISALPSYPSDRAYGVSVLNDCKYGYDSKPDQLRLTLLRGSCWPDPHADVGHHEFTYALYPHGGGWQTAHTVRRGYELNQPLVAISVDSTRPALSPPSSLPPIARLLGWSAENLVLMAFKPAEDQPNQWILRCHEAWGQSASLKLASDLPLRSHDRVDLLERSLSPTDDPPSCHTVLPWQIVSIVVTADTLANQ